MGYFLALLSAGFASAKDLISKRLAVQLDGTTSTFASFAYALPFYLVLLGGLWASGVWHPAWTGTLVGVLFLRSLTDVFAEGMKMHAFRHGDISVVASFLSLMPLFLLVTSPLITGERPTPLGILGVVLVVAGTLPLVYEPSGKGWGEQRKGILLGCASAFFFSLNNCFDALAMRPEPGGDGTGLGIGHAVFGGFTMTLLSGLLIGPLVLRRDRLQALGSARRPLLLRGSLEAIFMMTKLYAMQFLGATATAGIQRSSLLLSILGGHFLFGEKALGRRLAAGLVILAGVSLIVFFGTPR